MVAALGESSPVIIAGRGRPEAWHREDARERRNTRENMPAAGRGLHRAPSSAAVAAPFVSCRRSCLSRTPPRWLRAESAEVIRSPGSSGWNSNACWCRTLAVSVEVDNGRTRRAADRTPSVETIPMRLVGTASSGVKPVGMGRVPLAFATACRRRRHYDVRNRRQVAASPTGAGRADEESWRRKPRNSARVGSQEEGRAVKAMKAPYGVVVFVVKPGRGSPRLTVPAICRWSVTAPS